MTYHSKDKKEISLEVQKMMYQPNLEHKLSLLMLIRFYKNLLDNNQIQVNGAAHSRLKELELKYHDKSSKK